MIFKGNTVTSIVTGKQYTFRNKETRRDAVSKLKADDAQKFKAIESRLGRPLTEKEKLRGTIEHTEERSDSDLMRRDAVVREQPQPPENPHRAAADWMKAQQDEQELNPRQRGILAAEQAADELDARLAAEAEREAQRERLESDPEVVAAVSQLT